MNGHPAVAEDGSEPKVGDFRTRIDASTVPACHCFRSTSLLPLQIPPGKSNQLSGPRPVHQDELVTRLRGSQRESMLQYTPNTERLQPSQCRQHR
ncbi:Hypothetical predicted protein [Xyrichtys novacula]|uniref:Uncharacterized protein n=1 Tax=Xyrichtys novacula TaxID=13765 RepID=A0AAV1EWC3_XYRNO|nr:Hypothetical predicted protein [Xyrichtys novacula]